MKTMAIDIDSVLDKAQVIIQRTKVKFFLIEFIAGVFAFWIALRI